MTDQLTPGELVVAKGKLAKVQQIFSPKNIRVIVSASGEALMVSMRDIERIDLNAGITPDNNDTVWDINNYTEDALLLAAARFNVIKQWKAGEVTTSQACLLLNSSRSYFFKMARSY